MAWKKVTVQPKSKAWVRAEYSLVRSDNKDEDMTILVYKEDKKFQKEFGVWRVWIGLTENSDAGKYHRFDTEPLAMGFAKKYMKEHPKG